VTLPPSTSEAGVSRPDPGAAHAAPGPGVADLYAGWVTRIEMTFESVCHCCRYRLAEHPGGPDRVGLDVVAGLIERPRVFQFFGLPYSGRVGHLAEISIAEVRAGRATDCAATWTATAETLRAMPDPFQETIVAAFVDGLEDQELAAVLGSDAAERREAALATLRALATQLRVGTA